MGKGGAYCARVDRGECTEVFHLVNVKPNGVTHSLFDIKVINKTLFCSEFIHSGDFTRNDI